MRGLRLALPILILLVLAAGLLRARQARPDAMAPGPVPPLGPRLETPPSPRVAAIHVGFQDQSPTWDWHNRCRDALARFVQARGFPVAQLQVTLTDDHDLPLGVAYPDPEHPQALALGSCEAEETGLACRVALVQGQADPAGEAALAGVMAYAVSEVFRERSPATWAQREAWHWDRLAPLVRKEGDALQSDCLTLKGRE